MTSKTETQEKQEKEPEQFVYSDDDVNYEIQFKDSVRNPKGVKVFDIVEVLLKRLRDEQHCKSSRQQAIAITKLEEAKMWLSESEAADKEQEKEGALP